MNSYRTIEEARTAAANHPKKDSIKGIAEIVPGMDGVEKFILLNCTVEYFRVALRDRPMKEIKSVVGMVVDFGAEAAAAKLANIPGLAELQAAVNAWERYEIERERRLNSESMSSIIPARPMDPAEVAAKYPVAAAYLKADDWAGAANFEKVSAGKKAMKRIEAGENYETVIAEMEAEWTKAAMGHIWD
jgi:hypothetical protein